MSEALDGSRPQGESLKRFDGVRVGAGIALQGAVHGPDRRRLERFRQLIMCVLYNMFDETKHTNTYTYIYTYIDDTEI